MDKKTILKSIQSEMEKVDVACEWVDAGEESPVDLLITSHEKIGFFGQSALGEFFFLDYDKAAEGTEYIVCMLTLEDPVSMGNKTVLLDGINMLNYYMPYGAFAIGTEDEVILKMSLPLTEQIPTETAVAEVNTMVAHLLDLFHRYIGVVADLAAGKISPDEVVGLFEG